MIQRGLGFGVNWEYEHLYLEKVDSRGLMRVFCEAPCTAQAASHSTDLVLLFEVLRARGLSVETVLGLRVHHHHGLKACCVWDLG